MTFFSWLFKERYGYKQAYEDARKCFKESEKNFTDLYAVNQQLHRELVSRGTEILELRQANAHLKETMVGHFKQVSKAESEAKALLQENDRLVQENLRLKRKKPEDMSNAELAERVRNPYFSAGLAAMSSLEEAHLPVYELDPNLPK